MLNANDRIPVALEVQQWNQVLGLLGEAPWRIANPLMVGIMQQVEAAAGGAAVVEPLPPPLANGHDEAARSGDRTD